ncbi:SLC13 family permease [Paenarthrobacter aurescens]|uniref:Transporter n=1 Tax=Paenarthrobacter aurescens TaxID=43663 RepID=A0A4Y3N7S4_PAEAU|nr:SLC13 family permease [Paenarthrobacter aurescens]MDO6144733.1 anion permease [Paenarthrobacter aurescens]MDO6148577.1 anion permease [Paenarthrobacter aurescens]MDO6159824.1 anion permease [Paenarthrobacter aurescens]MDO6163687.1 anion permease [Paenarthrobacter aurescens]GEB17602.1 transporter [Paenarthrobacter aurescens]
MSQVYYSSVPQTPEGPSEQDGTRRVLGIFRPSAAIALLVAIALMVALAVNSVNGWGLDGHAAVTLCVFVAAIWFWIFSAVEDTYVALGAAVVLVISGTLPTESLFAALGEDSIWLLMAAFVIASAVASTGLAARGAAFILSGARSVRQLAYLSCLGLVVTAFAIPATSGRAALVLPIFLTLRKVFKDRPSLVKMLAVLFPTVILLSAVGSFLGAGAHLITSQILQSAGYPGFDFASWLLLGLPLSLASSFMATELVLRLFSSSSDRAEPLAVKLSQLQADNTQRISGPLDLNEQRSLLLLAAVVALWCTEPIHGLDPALVALMGALVVSLPAYGSVTLAAALKKVPWSMLIFMAATLALGSSLVTTGAAGWLAASLVGPVAVFGAAKPYVFVVVVVLASTAAHLVIQSRSARSAVLIPMVVATAAPMGVDPVAVAFASTAAAGFCHTLTSSAKPVAIFAETDGRLNYEPADLLRLSAWLAPLSAVLVLLFSFFLWPLLGLPLFTSP